MFPLADTGCALLRRSKHGLGRGIGKLGSLAIMVLHALTWSCTKNFRRWAVDSTPKSQRRVLRRPCIVGRAFRGEKNF